MAASWSPTRAWRAISPAGGGVRGVCHLRDCRRRCHLDLGRLLERAMGGLRVSELTPLYRCHRLDGCGLEFQEQYGAELTLAMLAGRDYVALRIACAQCGQATTARPEAVATRLQAQGAGGFSTEVRALPGLARTPCAKCQSSAWKVAVLWKDPSQAPSWLGRQGKRPAG